MNTKNDVVMDKDGNIVQAEVLICECGCELWTIYFVVLESGRHQHIQCAECGTSYCDNNCKASPNGH